MNQTCDDTLNRIGREVARAWKGQQSDEDALVAIDEALAQADDERDRARHNRFAPPDDDGADPTLPGSRGDPAEANRALGRPTTDGRPAQAPDGSPANDAD